MYVPPRVSPYVCRERIKRDRVRDSSALADDTLATTLSRTRWALDST